MILLCLPDTLCRRPCTTLSRDRCWLDLPTSCRTCVSKSRSFPCTVRLQGRVRLQGPFLAHTDVCMVYFIIDLVTMLESSLLVDGGTVLILQPHDGGRSRCSSSSRGMRDRDMTRPCTALAPWSGLCAPCAPNSYIRSDRKILKSKGVTCYTSSVKLCVPLCAASAVSISSISCISPILLCLPDTPVAGVLPYPAAVVG
jgi:hypothetical protein